MTSPELPIELQPVNLAKTKPVRRQAVVHPFIGHQVHITVRHIPNSPLVGELLTAATPFVGQVPGLLLSVRVRYGPFSPYHDHNQDYWVRATEVTELRIVTSDTTR